VLKERLLTALVLIPALLLVLLVLPRQAALFVLALLVLLGAWEWSGFLRTGHVVIRSGYVAVIGLLMGAAWAVSPGAPALQLLLAAALVWWLVAFLWVSVMPARVSAVAAAIAGPFVLVPAWVALGRLHLSQPAGPQWVIFLILLVALADVGAFFAGRRFGRLKLAPRVSPGKTWEGLFGGLCLAMVVAGAGLMWFAVPSGPFLALCAAVVLISVVGDLTESLFKRYAGIKDSGKVFPGHGGVLDRIDSLTAAAPLFLLGLYWLGVLA
jgi:phosphatidate cytidylyltransferase